jgi:fructose-1,6-bisphosphatase II
VGTIEGRCICGRFALVTEAGGLAAAEFVGRGDGLLGDRAARGAMASELAQMPVPFKARVVTGRGTTDPPYPLSVGEELGPEADAAGPGRASGAPDAETEQGAWDLAVAPLEGHAALARGIDGALCMMAAGPAGSLMAVPEMYMQKLIVGADAAAAIDIDAPMVDNVNAVAAALGRRPSELNVVVLDRPRHEDLIAQIKRSGARLKLIPDGDVSAAIAAATRDAGVDMYVGIGGSTEGIMAAAALRCLGGEMQARFWPVSRHQVDEVKAAGIEDIETRLSTTDMAGDGVLFVATAVTGARFLRGVDVRSDGVRSETLVLCSRCHAVRIVKTIHRSGNEGPRVSLDTR